MSKNPKKFEQKVYERKQKKIKELKSKSKELYELVVDVYFNVKEVTSYSSSTRVKAPFRSEVSFTF